ncbi:UNVERIFIED_ORG: hypothetical protein M2420_000820 [Stenotrophomonas maltophilia]
MFELFVQLAEGRCRGADGFGVSLERHSWRNTEMRHTVGKQAGDTEVGTEGYAVHAGAIPIGSDRPGHMGTMCSIGDPFKIVVSIEQSGVSRLKGLIGELDLIAIGPEATVGAFDHFCRAQAAIGKNARQADAPMVLACELGMSKAGAIVENTQPDAFGGQAASVGELGAHGSQTPVRFELIGAPASWITSIAKNGSAGDRCRRKRRRGGASNG